MLVIKADKRDAGAKLGALRKAGRIPAVFYGAGKKSTSISIGNIEFKKIWRQAGESSAVKIDVSGGEAVVVKSRPFGHPVAAATSAQPAFNEIDALIHEVQVDPVTDEPIHVDFLAIDMKKKIRVNVPLEFTGVSNAVKSGIGNLVKVLFEVEIEALPADLPHNLVVDISPLEGIENQIFVYDIKLPVGVVAVTNATDVVASVVAQVEEKEEVIAPDDLSAIEVEKKGKKDLPAGEAGEESAEAAEPAKEEKTEKKEIKK